MPFAGANSVQLSSGESQIGETSLSSERGLSYVTVPRGLERVNDIVVIGDIAIEALIGRLHDAPCWEAAMAEAKVAELERKVDTMMRGLNLLLFQQGEVFPEVEVQELRARLDDYLKGRRSEFLPLDELWADVQHTDSQEGAERDR